MEFIPQLTTIGLVLLLACISPGPDFIAVTSHSLSSRRSGLQVAYGISAAIALWAAFTIAGLALILSQVAGLYEVLRLAGAAYLVYLGVRMLTSAGQEKPQTQIKASHRLEGSVRRGFIIGITNPKSAAFFSSLFATVLPAHAPGWVYIATIGIAAGVAVTWFTVLAILFSVDRIQLVYRRSQRWIDVLMGSVLAALGIRLALSR